MHLIDHIKYYWQWRKWYQNDRLTSPEYGYKLSHEVWMHQQEKIKKLMQLFTWRNVMKVSELEGQLLDRWVAKAEGIKLHWSDGDCYRHYWINDQVTERVLYRPSANWSQAGPIIEREGIEITGSRGQPKHAQIYRGGHMWIDTEGHTPLIAAMRCFVASKFGEEVEDITP